MILCSFTSVIPIGISILAGILAVCVVVGLYYWDESRHDFHEKEFKKED